MFIVGAGAGPADVVAEGKPFGINTAFTTCTTPLVHTVFAIVTWTEFVSPVIVTVAGSDKSTVRLFPSNSVGNSSLFVKSVDKAETPFMTWYFKTSPSVSGDIPSVTAAIAANASFVGANTVIEPGAERASTRLAVVKAATKDDKSGRLSAVSTMFIVGDGAGPA